MPIFFLSYDLNHADGPSHYTGFAEAMQKLNVCRVLNNSALVHVNTDSARALVEHLRPFLEPEDRIFAVRVTPDNMFYLNTYPGTNDWVAQNLQITKPETPAPDAS